MRKLKSIIMVFSILVFTLLLLVGCSSISVTQDYDTTYDFSKLKTFGFIPLSKDANIDQLNANRISDAIKNDLTAKGYSLAENADFGIALLFGKQTKTNIDTYGYGYGPYWGRYGGMGSIDVTQYDEGTLIIEFVDISKKQVIWRGSGTGVIDRTASMDERTERINNAVTKILAQFPPTKSEK